MEYNNFKVGVLSAIYTLDFADIFHLALLSFVY